MAAKRADAETNGSAGVPPLSLPGNHDSAPHGACFHDLREALQVVIGSVDRLRDEILPDICGKLRNIETSTHAGAASRAPSEADTAGSSTAGTEQLKKNKMDPRWKLAKPPRAPPSPSGATSGAGSGELRDVLMSLHEHLEERMQAMYQQHSVRWEERLQVLLEAHREPQRMLSFSSRPSKSGLAIAGRNQSPCIGHWRDPHGEFWYGTTIVIGEEGWHPLEAGMHDLEPDAAKPVELLSASRCRLLLPAGEENSQGAPLEVEVGPDDTLIATPMDGTHDSASYTLSRVGSRQRSKQRSGTPDGSSAMRLLTPGQPMKVRSLAGRFVSSVTLSI